MKKLFAVILALLCLTSCSKTIVEYKKPTMKIGSTVSFSLSDIAYSATVLSNSYDNYELEFTVPAELKGMKINVKQSACTVSYDGITLEYGNSTVAPEIVKLCECLNTIEKTMPTNSVADKVGKVLTFDGENKSTVCVDENNCITKISVDKSDFKVLP